MTARCRLSLAVVALASAATIAASPRQDWRSLALESFDVIWRTVQDTHYDPRLGGVDWAAVRRELRPRVETATSLNEARVAMRDMLGRLGQSHYELIARGEGPDELKYGPATVPIDMRIAQAGAIVTAVSPRSSAYQSGLRPGDVLVSIDDVPVVVDANVARATSSALRDLARWERVSQALSGGIGDPARLVWRRPDGTERRADVVRVEESGEVVSFGNLPPVRVRVDTEEVRLGTGGTVGVIGFNIWMVPIAEPFAEAIDRFRAADGLVIDLRGNPGGIAEMIRGISGHLLNEPQLLGRMQMRDVLLEFRANPRRSTSDGRAVEPFSGPVAVLVDGLTASASECFAGALQSLGRVRVFGTQTMGQALPAATRVLPTGDVLMYVVGDFVTSTGRRLETDGVVPDEVVPLVPADLAAGRDARARAISWIAEQARRR